MRNKLILITVFFLCFIFAEPEKIYARSSKDDHLWLEFGKQIKEKNGSVTQLLYIYYGRFPDKKKDAYLELGDFRAFYSQKEKDKERGDIFYEVNIEKDAGKPLIRINSLKTDCFRVLVEGKRNFGGIKYNYLAKASFILFGHSPFKRKKMTPVPSIEVEQQFEIYIAPEFSVWPQTGEPVKISALYNQAQIEENQEQLVGKDLYILGENGNMIDIKTDETGYYTYIPLEDKKLNWKSETVFKQIVVVAEETKQNSNFISSYTLKLHRSRFKNCKMFPGLGIFCGTVACVFLVIVGQRKRFKF